MSQFCSYSTVGTNQQEMNQRSLRITSNAETDIFFHEEKRSKNNVQYFINGFLSDWLKMLGNHKIYYMAAILQEEDL